MAHWTPAGYVGQLFRATGRHVPPPPGLQSPVRWGDEAAVRELLGGGVADLQMARHVFVQRWPSPAFYVEFIRRYYGPTLKAFEALDGEGQRRQAADMEALVREHNVSGDDTVVFPSEYLEIVATRR